MNATRKNNALVKLSCFVRSAITRMLGLKLMSGSSVQELRDFLDECIGESVSLHSTRDKNSAFDIHSIGGVLRSWHTETEFLRPDGMPKPLAHEGRSGLKKLVAMHFPTKPVLACFCNFASKWPRKKHGGRAWIPTDRHARVPKATCRSSSTSCGGSGATCGNCDEEYPRHEKGRPLVRTGLQGISSSSFRSRSIPRIHATARNCIHHGDR